MKRTDLACEMGKKPNGSYITLHCDKYETPQEITALTNAIEKFLPDLAGKKTLVVGLGNENITPDSLGVRAAERILATAHFKGHDEFAELGLREVYVIQPGVMAQTGLESAEQLMLIANGIAPDCLIVIDSLACSDRKRLARTIQITDTGIAPGSGVQNQRKEFSQGVFGVPVIAIGVPLVMDMNEGEQEALMMVPRDIDVIVRHYAKVIGAAVNLALNPALDEEEIEGLLM